MTLHLSQNRERPIKGLVEDGQSCSEGDVIEEALRLLGRPDGRCGRDADRRTDGDRHRLRLDRRDFSIYRTTNGHALKIVPEV